MQKRKSLLERKRFFASVRHACRGMCIAFREEQNIRIHGLCAVIVIFFAVFLKVSILEYIAIFFSITLVIVMELVNSIFERFSDMIQPQVSHLIAKIKDMSAAAVLLCALNACIVGGSILFPKLFRVVQSILF